MKSDKFTQYSKYISSRTLASMTAILSITIFQYIIVTYLSAVNSNIPFCKPKISEWFVIMLETGFIFALLFFHHFMLRQQVLSNYLLKIYDEPPPENSSLDKNTFLLLRLFTYINIISIFKMIIAYFPALISLFAFLCGFSKGNFTTFTLLSIAMIAGAYPSKSIKKQLIYLLEFIEDGTS